MNLDKKGKARDTTDASAPAPDPSGDNTADSAEATPATEDAAEAPEAEGGDEVDNATPADGVSDLAPAPTPEGLVPSTAMPHKVSDRAVKYDLPDGVAVDDCAIFYIGGESLGLNNLLITHGRCTVSRISWTGMCGVGRCGG